MGRSRVSKVVIKDRGWTALRNLIREIHQNKLTLKVGVLSDEKPEGSDLNYAEIAAVQEFGSKDKHTPERSFLRSTFDEQVPFMTTLAKRLLALVLQRRLSATDALNILGGHLSEAVKAKILDGPGVPPPNAESTIRQKLREASRSRRLFRRAASTLGQALAQVGAAAAVRTLVATGRMVGLITYQVVRGRPKE